MEHAGIYSETTEMIPIASVTNVTVADDTESFVARSLYMYRYVIISASSSLLLIIASFSVLIMLVICIYKIRKRRRQASCRNLERQYETVDEPIYEMVLNNNPNNMEVWSDCDTKCNEAYEKSGAALHLYSELYER